MRILIIEDERSKFRDLEFTLNRILHKPLIDRKETAVSGLRAIKDARDANEDYDVIITDNYMPLCNNSKIEPHAEYILEELERLGVTSKIIVCSSGEVEDCEDIGIDYEFVLYNPSVVLDDKLRDIIGG